MSLCKYLVFLISTLPGLVKEQWDEQKRLKEEKVKEQEEYEEEKRRRIAEKERYEGQEEKC